MRRALGVCYYPEHWPESLWAEDAARMATTGLRWVRIGEFAWSRIEPEPGRLDWGWLDRAMDTLGAAGLRVVLGTPTATPPRWMLTRWPDMLALDAQGRPRGFGSRRHYCFSHEGYRRECVRIVTLLAERYAGHPALAAWQTDNEYGCHDTVLSYSAAARTAFRDWLARRYQSPQALNREWGNVFWSMEVADFAEIDLPMLTVTEPNPAHVMAFRRFSSDQVVSFNALQVAVIRRFSDAPITHNFMGRISEFDHFALGVLPSWDSYPIGFLSDRVDAAPEHRQRFLRQGDPDFQAFHHDLYRAVGGGRWWVMEQQPGPVNWAPWNPAPLPGAVRLWTWEAFAHGAEIVSYFRWRQAPFGQEQMHAGLLRPDSEPAPGHGEAARVAAELSRLPDVETAPAPVALVFDYPSAWAWATQPQGRDFDYFRLVFAFYRGLRRLGLSVDMVPATVTDLSGFRLVLAPGLATIPPALAQAMAAVPVALVGPRSGAKTAEFATPVPLPPGLPGLDARVGQVESIPPGTTVPLGGGGAFVHWREWLEGSATVVERTAAGEPAVMASGGLHYLGGWPDEAALDRWLRAACAGAGIPVEPMPDGLRARDAGPVRFYLNYGPEPVTHGGRTIAPAGVVALRGGVDLLAEA